MLFTIQAAIFVGSLLLMPRNRFSGKEIPTFDPKFPNRLRSVLRIKGRVRFHHLGVLCAAPLTFMVRRERFYDRFFKRIGLANEAQIPNAEMDQKLFFTTDQSKNLEKLLRSPKLQSLIQEFFRLPVKQLVAAEDRIYCDIAGKDLEKDDEYFQKHWQLLEAISKKLTQAHTPAPEPIVKKAPLASLLMAIQGAAVLTAMFGSVVPIIIADEADIIDQKQWLIVSVAMAALASIIWIVLVCRLLKGTSWLSTVLIPFLLAGWLGFFACSIFIVREANIRFDRSPATTHKLTILKKECEFSCPRRFADPLRYTLHESACDSATSQEMTRQLYARDFDYCARGTFEYEMQLSHWRNDADVWQSSSMPTQTINIDSNSFAKAEVGDNISVTSYSGFLGIEWTKYDSLRIYHQRNW